MMHDPIRKKDHSDSTDEELAAGPGHSDRLRCISVSALDKKLGVVCRFLGNS